MKQTAVEWLVEQITDSTMPAREAIKQAKEMEKEQIIEAFKTGTKMVDVENELDALFNAIIYYKETYESND